MSSQRNIYVRGAMALMWLRHFAGGMLVLGLRVHVTAGRLVAVAAALFFAGPRLRACAILTLRGSCLASSMGLWGTPTVGLRVWMDPCCSMPRACCWIRVKDAPTYSRGFCLDTQEAEAAHLTGHALR